MAAGQASTPKFADESIFILSDGWVEGIKAKKKVCMSFDLDGTLWPPAWPVLERAGQEQAQWMESNYPLVFAQHLDDPALAKAMTKLAETRPDIAHCFTALRHTALLEAFQDAVDTGLCETDPSTAADEGLAVFRKARNRVTPYPGVHECLAALHEKSGTGPEYTVVTLTNGNSVFDETSLAGLAAVSLSATDAGAAKPDPAMFEAVVTATGIAANATVHFGDDVECDVRGAKRCGMHAVLVIPPEPEPVASKPAASEPAASEPAASEPAAPEPAASEPAASEPAASEPAASACASTRKTTDETSIAHLRAIAAAAEREMTVAEHLRADAVVGSVADVLKLFGIIPLK